ncbi:unnamed protein product [Rotaria sordida]|uniref:SPX domain-containing protein n=1 Tax=Rotaria sordida TaxID=392033 RepID=A0A815CFY8_9BILA|nr:unnamed protein product [Rotaria sordida]
MKFGLYLSKNRTPEWYSQYIEYDEMKRMLTESVAEAERLIDINDRSAREQFFVLADEQFFQFCKKEASKINNFFAEKLAEALRLFEPLKNELKNSEQSRRSRQNMNSTVLDLDGPEGNHDERDNGMLLADSSSRNTFRSWLARTKLHKPVETIRKVRMKRTRHLNINNLKLAFSEFYLMLVLLKNYQTLNSTGFRKILKKHDKLFQTTRGDEWRKVHIDTIPFHTSNRIDELMTEVENLYTDTLESGDRTKAMQRLRVPPLEERQSPLVTFRVGMFVGMLCLLIPMIFILISRRFIWNYFRLENEHLNNCGEFRAVRDIPIQMTVAVASGYAARLESIGSISNLEDERNAIRRQSTISGEQITGTDRSRKLTVLNEAFDAEATLSTSLTTETNRNQARNVSYNLESSSNTASSSNSLAVANPYYTRTQPT